MRTGAPIVYTSADSVFQIAAHEDVMPVPELYRLCEIAFDLVGNGLGVGRVIARPFVGAPGCFPADGEPPRLRADAVRADAARRADGRRHTGRSPSARSRICSPGAASPTAIHTTSDADGMDEIERALDATAGAASSSPISSTSTPVYGHRNDPAGYAANLERFDARLRALLPRIGRRDLLIITADHGNDPTTPSTDHSREHVPLSGLRAQWCVRRRSRVRQTFADLGQTVADFFGVGPLDTATAFCRYTGSP